jgi:hypothetical protein
LAERLKQPDATLPPIWRQDNVETPLTARHNSTVACRSTEGQSRAINGFNWRDLVKSHMLRFTTGQFLKRLSKPLDLLAPKLVEANQWAVI